jgi:hypothetical protein
VGNVLINEATLSSIANAIREKNGTTETYKPAEMVEAIQSIQSGGVLNSGFGARFINSSMSANDVNNILIDAVANGVTTIPNYRFYDGDNNDIEGGGTLYIPQGITTIGEYAFTNCEIEKIELPAGLITIGASAFDGCGDYLNAVKNKLVIPSSVETIGKNAFGSNYNLSAVYFKGTPTSIGVNCFNSFNHSLTDIYVPWSENNALNNVAWNGSSATIHYNYTE